MAKKRKGINHCYFGDSRERNHAKTTLEIHNTMATRFLAGKLPTLLHASVGRRWCTGVDTSALSVHPSRQKVQEENMLESERTQEIHQQRPKTKLTHRRRYERKAILLEREDKRQGRDTLSASFLRSRFRTPTSATYANMSPILNAMQVIKGPDAGPYQTAVAYLLEVRGEDGIPDAFRFLEHMQRSKISPIGPVYALIIQAAVTPKTFHGVLQRMAESSVSYDRAVLGALTCRGAKSATLDEIWDLFKQHIEAPGISPLEYEHDKGGNSEVVHAVLERAESVQDLLRIMKLLKERFGQVHVRYSNVSQKTQRKTTTKGSISLQRGLPLIDPCQE